MYDSEESASENDSLPPPLSDQKTVEEQAENFVELPPASM
jgi:hypothetical protein